MLPPSLYSFHLSSLSLSFSFIGKGLIDLSPQEVYNCVRNPNQRFIFDNMLKVKLNKIGNLFNFHSHY